MEIREKINRELDQYKKPVKVADILEFDKYQILRRAVAYLNSRFLKGQYDVNGKRKFFHNIVFYRKENTRKEIDIDTKAFRVFSKTASELKAWLLEQEIKTWMYKHNFGALLNKMADSLASYGSVVLKKVKGKDPEVVDLLLLHSDQGVSNLHKSSSVIEEHRLSVNEIEEMDEWDADVKQELIDAYEDKKMSGEYEDDFIRVYERYGYVGKGKDRKYILTFIAGTGEFDSEVGGKTLPKTFILYEKELKPGYLPYEEYHLRQINGRWLGIGDVELLTDTQIRINELKNQLARAMDISSLNIFQTQSETAVGNLTVDYDNGDVIVAETPISSVPTENRDLSSFQIENGDWDMLADRLTFSYDLIRGQKPETRVQSTVAVIQDRNAKSMFKIYKQEFALMLERFFNKQILPEILKSINMEHILRFAGDPTETERLDNLIADVAVNSYANDYLNETGWYPLQSELDEVRQDILDELKKTGRARKYKIPKGFFSELDYEVQIAWGDESIAPQIEVNNIQTFMAMMAQNPNIMSDPVMKRFVFKFANLLGISPVELEEAHQLQVNQQQNVQTIPAGATDSQANIQAGGLASAQGNSQQISG